MAVGDIVNATQAGGGFHFQPAVGVSIMITAVIGSSTTVAAGLSSDSITNSQTYISNSTNNGNKNSLNVKIGITNSVYLYYYGNSNTGYTGIQIQ